MSDRVQGALRRFIDDSQWELLAALRHRRALRAELVGNADDEVELLVEFDRVPARTQGFADAASALAHDIRELAGVKLRVGPIDELAAVTARVGLLDGSEPRDPIGHLVRLQKEVEAVLRDYDLKLVGFEVHHGETRARDAIVWADGELRLKAVELPLDPHPVLGAPSPAGFLDELEWRLMKKLSVWVIVEVVE